MTPLSDHDLQALLSGDADGTEDDLDAVSRASLDAYQAVWAELESEPAGFAPGFADRVAAAVEAERETASVPSRAGAWPLASGLAAVLLLVFRDTLAATLADIAPTDALPWLAAALLAVACSDLAERARRRTSVV